MFTDRRKHTSVGKEFSLVSANILVKCQKNDTKRYTDKQEPLDNKHYANTSRPLKMRWFQQKCMFQRLNVYIQGYWENTACL